VLRKAAAATDRRRRYCDEHRGERFREDAHHARQRAAHVLAQLRAERRDLVHGGRLAEMRGAKNATHQAAVPSWQGERPDPDVFRLEILPAMGKTDR